jgi:hypothetical protein
MTVRPRLDQLRRERRKSIITALREPDVEPDVPAVDIAQFTQPPQQEWRVNEVERPTGNSAAAAMRRLRKDRPDIHIE